MKEKGRERDEERREREEKEKRKEEKEKRKGWIVPDPSHPRHIPVLSPQKSLEELRS